MAGTGLLEVLDLSQPDEADRLNAQKRYISQGPIAYRREDEPFEYPVVALQAPTINHSLNASNGQSVANAARQTLPLPSSSAGRVPNAQAITPAKQITALDLTKSSGGPANGQTITTAKQTTALDLTQSFEGSSLQPSSAVVDLTDPILSSQDARPPGTTTTQQTTPAVTHDGLCRFVFEMYCGRKDYGICDVLTPYLIAMVKTLVNDYTKTRSIRQEILRAIYRTNVYSKAPQLSMLCDSRNNYEILKTIIPPDEPLIIELFKRWSGKPSSQTAASAHFMTPPAINISGGSSPILAATSNGKQPMYGNVFVDWRPSGSSRDSYFSTWPEYDNKPKIVTAEDEEMQPWLTDEHYQTYRTTSAYKGDITTLFDDYHLEGLENNVDVTRAMAFLGFGSTRKASDNALALAGRSSSKPQSSQESQSAKSPIKAVAFYNAPPEPERTRPNGMKVALMPHQTLGLEFMVKREDQYDLFAKKKGKVNKCRGGILADEMGLGKTIQTLALMCHNKDSTDGRKANLIIAPLALLEQWRLEICDKTEHNTFKILIYHGLTRPRTLAALEGYDVVLTTYHTLVTEFPKRIRTQRGQRGLRKQETEAEWEIRFEEEKGHLFRVEWHRIVLDEAHTIRNSSSRASQAVARLDSTNRWCLTGTPIVNTLQDAWPLFRFLHFYPWQERDHFRDRIANYEKTNPSMAGNRLQVILRGCMLRRKKDSTLDGKPIIQLPNKTVLMDEVELDDDEKAIYQAVEANMVAIFNRYLEAGTVLKNYSHIFVMLLRLRQACTHPLLCAEQGTPEPPPIPQDELERARKKMKPEVLQRVTLAIQKYRDYLDHSTNDDVKEIPSDLSEMSEFEFCQICMEPSGESRMMTNCGHWPFCKQCITIVLQGPQSESWGDGQDIRDKRPCPHCRQPLARDDIYSIDALLKAFELANSRDNEPPEKRRKKNKGPAVASSSSSSAHHGETSNTSLNRLSPLPLTATDDDATTEDTDDEDSDYDGSGALPADSMARIGSRRDITKSAADVEEIVKVRNNPAPSAKLKRIIAYLQQWQVDNADDKVIIISQWTALLDILGDTLYHLNMPFVRYDGAMKPDARDKAVRSFQFDASPMIMLMSLKAGGVGLNLTRANRVINCDLAWNPASENQAFDRCHRLGQLKDVFVSRLYVKNTVEDRMHALQERKQMLSDAALGGGAHKMGRMTVQDLKYLFHGNGAPAITHR